MLKVQRKKTIFAAESPVPLLMEGEGVVLIINTNRL